MENEIQIKKQKWKKYLLYSIGGILLILTMVTFIKAGNPSFSIISNTTDVLRNNTRTNLTAVITNLDATGRVNLTVPYLNNRSLYNIYLPFENNATQESFGSIIDYSGYNTSFTTRSKNVTLATTGCIVGNCYNFSGQQSFMNSTSRSNYMLVRDNFTLMEWVMFRTLPSSGGILIGANGRPTNPNAVNYGFQLTSVGVQAEIRRTTNNANTNTSSYNFTSNKNAWQHLAMTFNGRNLTLYVNGTQVNTTDTGGGIIDYTFVGTQFFNIGIGQTAGSANVYLNGSMDEIILVNRTLTSEQIKRYYTDSLNNHITLQNLVSNETKIDDAWRFAGYVTNKSDTGTQLNSSEILILNNRPTQSQPYLNTTLSANTTDADLLLYNISTSEDVENDVIVNSFKIYNPSGTINASRIFQTDNGLVAYFPFENGTTQDFSLNSNDATSNGLVSNITNGRIGRIGVGFENGPMNISDRVSLEITGAITLEAWVYHRNSEQSKIITKVCPTGQSCATGYEYDFYLSATDKLVFGYDFDGTPDEFTSTNSVSTNAWHHVAVTRDGAVDGAVILYIDGNPESFVQVITPIANGQKVRIGGDAGSANRFRGMIDEVGIWNRVLSASEIQSHYRAGQDAMVGEAFRIKGTLATGTWTAQITPIDFRKNGLLVSTNTSIVINALGGGDTCTPPAINNNWLVNYPDNCSVSSNVNLGGGNLSLGGLCIGTFNLLGGNITTYSLIDRHSTPNLCYIINRGGSIVIKQ